MPALLRASSLGPQHDGLCLDEKSAEVPAPVSAVAELREAGVHDKRTCGRTYLFMQLSVAKRPWRTADNWKSHTHAHFQHMSSRVSRDHDIVTTTAQPLHNNHANLNQHLQHRLCTRCL